MGADVVGGCPYNELNWDETCGTSTAYSTCREARRGDRHACRFRRRHADRRFASARYIAEKTIATGYQGRVALGHVTSLGALEADEAKPVIDLLHKADIHIVTLPATDVYLGGRGDAAKPRRGLTPVRALHAAGVNVAYSSNNIRNAFTPFGKADPLQIGNLLAHLVQFGTPEHQAEILKMATTNAARAVGVSEDYGLAVGKQADLVILDTFSVADALLDLPARSWVLKRGRITVVTTVETRVCRDCGHMHARTGSKVARA